MNHHGGTCDEMFSQSHPTMGGHGHLQLKSGVYWLCGGLNVYQTYQQWHGSYDNVTQRQRLQQRITSTAHPLPQVIH